MNTRILTAERRVNMDLRKKVDEMSREELIKALLTDEMTGLPNLRAYHEAQRLPIQVMCDLDGLKYVNDTFGYAAGDDLILALADTLAALDLTAYRSNTSGDEFILEFDSWGMACMMMDRLQDILKETQFCVDTVIPGHALQGIGLSFGVSNSIETAELRLKMMKARRKEEGKLSNRGARPHYLQEVKLQPIR